MEQLAARRAHNPEVTGSNPVPATPFYLPQIPRLKNLHYLLFFQIYFKTNPQEISIFLCWNFFLGIIFCLL